MKVFISWSGVTSHNVAMVLRDYFPIVIQSIEPYVSSEDIDKGARWNNEISKELEQCQFGILCITKDNREAPWLLFEAGALAKNIDISRVTPFLFGVKDEDLPPPLRQFQTTKFIEGDVKKMIHSLNKANNSGELPEALLNKSFENWWPTINKSMSDIKLPATTTSDKADRSPLAQDLMPEMLEKMLDLLQRQHRLLSSPEQLVPREYLHSALGSLHSALGRQVLGNLDTHLAYRDSTDHPVYLDLSRAWAKFKSYVHLHCMGDSVSSDDINDLYSGLRRPIEFIIERSSMRRKGPGLSAVAYSKEARARIEAADSEDEEG